MPGVIRARPAGLHRDLKMRTDRRHEGLSSSEGWPRPGISASHTPSYTFWEQIRTESCDELWSLSDVKTTRHSAAQHQDEERRGQMVHSQWDAGMAGPGLTWSFVPHQDPALSPWCKAFIQRRLHTLRKMTGWGVSRLSPVMKELGMGQRLGRICFLFVWDWDQCGGRCEVWGQCQETAGPCQPHLAPAPAH